METVQQNGHFTLFSSKFHSNIYSILFGYIFVFIYLTFQLIAMYYFKINTLKF